MEGPSGAALSRPRRRSKRGSMLSWVLLAGLCMLPCTAGTCATYASWLRTDKVIPGPVTNCGGGVCSKLHGFFAIHVAPDAKSILVNMQITSESGAGIRTVTGAGIFGPALADQVKPQTAGMLLNLGQIVLQETKTWVGSVRLESPKMQEILTYMREGRTYISIMTSANPNGELRGQIEPPTCLEASLNGASYVSSDGTPVQPHGFANVLISASKRSYAALLQVAVDDARSMPGVPDSAQARTFGGVDIFPTPFSLSKTDFYYRITSPDDRTQMIPVSMPQGEVNRADQPFKVYKVGHVVADAVISALMTEGANMRVTSPHIIITTPPTTYQIMGNLTRATPCRHLMTPNDSLFSIARARRSDWLTVWSLNEGNPDVRLTLEPRYFAHPYQVSSGETAAGIMQRFGMSEKELYDNNPTVKDMKVLSLGTTLCIVPNWLQTIGGNGQKICSSA